MLKCSAVLALVLCSALTVSAATVKDFGTSLPYEFTAGVKVNGFQDDFTSYALTSDSSALTAALAQNGWVWVSRVVRTTGTTTLLDALPDRSAIKTTADGRQVLFLSSSGTGINVNDSGTVNNHLIYKPSDPSLDYSTGGSQEILMHIQVTSIATQITAVENYKHRTHGGAGVLVNADTSRGVDVVFTRRSGEMRQRDFSMGYNNGYYSAFGTGPDDNQHAWALNEWYWVRLKYDDDAGMIFTKIWLSDTPEPDEWQKSVAASTAGTTTGWAGITATCGGLFEFNVDYVLIKAGALPEIWVGNIPEPATMSLLALGGLALLRRRR